VLPSSLLWSNTHYTIITHVAISVSLNRWFSFLSKISSGFVKPRRYRWTWLCYSTLTFVYMSSEWWLYYQSICLKHMPHENVTILPGRWRLFGTLNMAIDSANSLWTVLDELMKKYQSVICSAALRTKGAAGMDAFSWWPLCTSVHNASEIA